jgi:putative tryptophan/tyrosine transport system substrate-binding protein
MAWPLAARAQQPAKVPRIGILSPAASETGGTLTAFREGIRDLGYVEGQTIALDFRLSKGITDSLPALAAELVRIPVNVIVTDGTSATLAAFAATHSIPIVMGTTGGDPVALGLAKSLSRPGGNVTGTQFLAGLSEKRLQLLKQAFPGAQRVAVLANPKEAIDISEMPKAEMAAARMGVRLVPRRARRQNCVHSRLPRYQVATASSVCRVECSGITGRQSSTLHRGLACPPFTRSGNTPTMEGSSPTGPMYPSISI